MSKCMSWDNTVRIVTCFGRDGTRSESWWGQIFHTCLDWPWGPLSLLYVG